MQEAGSFRREPAKNHRRSVSEAKLAPLGETKRGANDRGCFEKPQFESKCEVKQKRPRMTDWAFDVFVRSTLEGKGRGKQKRPSMTDWALAGFVSSKRKCDKMQIRPRMTDWAFGGFVSSERKCD